ncbi:FeoA family protein [Acidithiobacillus sp.]
MLQQTTLEQINPGQCAVIQGISAGRELSRRMIALGLRPGSQLLVLRRAALHGPLQVRVGHTEIMIRRGEAAKIWVRFCPGDAA